MKKDLSSEIEIYDDHLGCLGEFNPRDKICVKWCALNLRCAIEQDHNERMEFLDDLLASEVHAMRIQ
ncbi:conserved hypothetical protein [Candidatus Magnetomoraceae bacterium gMMP-15]